MSEDKNKPTIAISACVLGDPVRYNGGHSEDRWITRQLSKYVNFKSFCPEVTMGLGTPREEIQLYYKKDDRKNVFLRSKSDSKDLTELAQNAYKEIDKDLENSTINGFVMMRKSPSCGHYNVKTVSEDDSGPVVHSQGLYASYLESRHPETPFIDSGKIKNTHLREQFIKNVFAHHRLLNVESNITSLQLFHQRYKYIIMEHSHSNVSKLGQIAANSNNRVFGEVYKEYKTLFLATLIIEPNVNTRSNVFLHLMGYLKKQLSADEKEEILNLFDEYKEGIHSIAVPINLLKIYIKTYNVEYLVDQYYFNPYPKEIKLLKDI
jgi:uncharacterized protein YbgA (DUF1722 family)/uncharacterized protein YbbK (DUF523 family)